MSDDQEGIFVGRQGSARFRDHHEPVSHGEAEIKLVQTTRQTVLERGALSVDDYRRLHRPLCELQANGINVNRNSFVIAGRGLGLDVLEDILERCPPGKCIGIGISSASRMALFRELFRCDASRKSLTYGNASPRSAFRRWVVGG